jgi:SAM-dependent methyltransferase
VTFEKGDLQDLRFAPATFDVVWSQFVLYFLEDPKRAMQGFRRITKPGGKVVAALHQLPAFNFPTDAEVLEPMGAFTRLILAGLRPEAMPSSFTKSDLRMSGSMSSWTASTASCLGRQMPPNSEMWRRFFLVPCSAWRIG